MSSTVLLANLVRLVLEGIFEIYSNLTVAFVEGEFGWVSHLMWRMDKDYKVLSHQAPRLKHLPSEYIKENLKFTTQPIEEPEKLAHLGQIIEMMGGDHMLMYCSDFPHYDYDPPSVFPNALGNDLLKKFFTRMPYHSFVGLRRIANELGYCH